MVMLMLLKCLLVFFAEPTQELGLTPETITVMGSPFALFGLYTLPWSSPSWWKPSTFGGDVGMKIIMETRLIKDLICRNLKGKCPDSIGFKVPKSHATHSDL